MPARAWGFKSPLRHAVFHPKVLVTRLAIGVKSIRVRRLVTVWSQGVSRRVAAIPSQGRADARVGHDAGEPRARPQRVGIARLPTPLITIRLGGAVLKENHRRSASRLVASGTSGREEKSDGYDDRPPAPTHASETADISHAVPPRKWDGVAQPSWTVGPQPPAT